MKDTTTVLIISIVSFGLKILRCYKVLECKSSLCKGSIEEHFITKKNQDNVHNLTEDVDITKSKRNCNISKTDFDNENTHYKSDQHSDNVSDNVSERKSTHEKWKIKIEELGVRHKM